VTALLHWASWKGLAIPCEPRLELHSQVASESIMCTMQYTGHPWAFDQPFPTADGPGHRHRYPPHKPLCQRMIISPTGGLSMSRGGYLHPGTVSNRDVAIEPTRMYLRRVPGCKYPLRLAASRVL